MSKASPPESDERAYAREIFDRLAEAHPDATCALDYRNPFHLLIATILSAQCTDERVNQVTPDLFARYPDAAALAASNSADVEELIHSTGFYRQKTRSIRGAAEMIVAEHGGEVPDTMTALTGLPGVARKTANVVLGNAFEKAEGIAVDTHVKRVAFRLGLTEATRPGPIEKDLMALYPQSRWTMVTHLLIFHGRRICSARSPACDECPVADLCPQHGVD
ncbi:MAG: endonuclease III [Phycisphaeraceae bacterium]|nr:endonuclease III [Phycisphaeraceae bacterium]